jgi:hypothetical protein
LLQLLSPKKKDIPSARTVDSTVLKGKNILIWISDNVQIKTEVNRLKQLNLVRLLAKKQRKPNLRIY